MTEERKTIVLTGFGPFRNYDVNPSWEIVKDIELDNVNLVKKQIEVSYEAVNQEITKIWKELKPNLIVHCGVSYIAKDITIETSANGFGYCNLDVRNCLPDNQCSFLQTCSQESLKTEIDCKTICDQINHLVVQNQLEIGASISNDAKRYLCEYIYFTSLKHCPKQSLFLHVPELKPNSKYTVENLRKTVYAIIEILLKSI